MAGQHVIRLAAAAVEQARPSRHLRRHRLALRRRRRARPGQRGAGAPRACARRSARRSPRRSAREFGVREPARARVREGLRAVLHARGARRRDGQQEALRGARGRPGEEALELVGLEAVRRDWSAVARRFQRELLQLVPSTTEPVEDFIRELRGRPPGRPVRRRARLPEGDPEAARRRTRRPRRRT